MQAFTSIKDLVTTAEDMEASDLPAASKLYEQVLKEDPLNEKAYNRLMLVYRKLKDYNAELQIINRGIKAYTDFYNKGKSKSKKVIDISNKLAKSFGLVDKKGNSTYDPEPIAKWEKRKMVVEKRLKPAKRK